MKELLGQLIRKTHIPYWLLATLAGVFALRIPSFFEPYWYGDEAVYLTLGAAVRQGLLLYRDIHDNKPPLLYLIAAIAGNVFWFKVILAFWSLATVYLFWKFAQRLFERNTRLVRYATVLFALLTTIPLLEGNVANAELFMIGPTILAFTLLLQPRLAERTIFIAGLLLSVAVLFKIPAGFDTGVIIILWIATALAAKEQNWKQVYRNIGVLIAGILTPILLTIIYFGIQGGFVQYVTGAFLQNIGYLSSWRGASGGFLTRNGPVLLRALIAALTVTTLVILYTKRRISRSFLLVGCWFITSLFAALLSERPYPHYLIQVVPSFSLLVGIAITLKTREQFFSYLFFALLGAALVFYKFSYYKVFPYYQNFLAWSTHQKSTSSYFDHFDGRVNRNYDIVRFLTRSTKPEERIFVWGNDPEIYVLTNILPPTRYIVAYHIQDFNGQPDTMRALQGQPPRFIIATLPLTSFPELATFLRTEYLPIEHIGNATIWLRMTRGLKDSKPQSLPRSR